MWLEIIATVQFILSQPEVFWAYLEDRFWHQYEEDYGSSWPCYDPTGQGGCD